MYQGHLGSTGELIGLVQNQQFRWRILPARPKRLIKPGQVFSRIHVDDLAAGLEASIGRPQPGRVYNLCDDEPAASDLVTSYAAALLGVDPPPAEPFDPATLSPMARRFWSENKRVSNARAKAALGWRPMYPTYREGLAAVLEAERATQELPSPLGGEGGRGAAG